MKTVYVCEGCQKTFQREDEAKMCEIGHHQTKGQRIVAQLRDELVIGPKETEFWSRVIDGAIEEERERCAKVAEESAIFASGSDTSSNIILRLRRGAEPQ